ncbi:MAG: hypothetical protein WBX15_05890 [Thermoanaerobaculia bacterium]
MGGEALFQICYEGDLTVEVCAALRRLRAEPNFDQSWEVRLPATRSAGAIARYLRMLIGGNARLLVARAQYSRHRELLLIRHSLTPGADYRELHEGIERLGRVWELPFESTFIVETDDPTDTRTLGEALVQLCPDEALMVTGIRRDLAYSTAALWSVWMPQPRNRGRAQTQALPGE